MNVFWIPIVAIVFGIGIAMLGVWTDHMRRTQSLITHLNDDHKWTREAIADWVEGIEREQEQAAAIVDAATVPA